jgi:hypothetical protein
MKLKVSDKTFEQVIRDNPNEFGVEGSNYIVTVLCDCGGNLNIILRPENRNGETVDYIVKGNNLVNAKNFNEQNKSEG